MPVFNLACGTDYRSGMINVDRSLTAKADLRCDLCVIPWPIDSNTATGVLLSNFVEHIPPDVFPAFMRELHRIAKDGCRVEIVSPHWSSDNFHADPTHRLPVAARTFDFFDPTTALGVNGLLYGWGDIVFRVEKAVLGENPPNGPNVYHTLRAVKSDAAKRTED